MRVEPLLDRIWVPSLAAMCSPWQGLCYQCIQLWEAGRVLLRLPRCAWWLYKLGKQLSLTATAGVAAITPMPCTHLGLGALFNLKSTFTSFRAELRARYPCMGLRIPIPSSLTSKTDLQALFWGLICMAWGGLEKSASGKLRHQTFKISITLKVIRWENEGVRVGELFASNVPTGWGRSWVLRIDERRCNDSIRYSLSNQDELR